MEKIDFKVQDRHLYQAKPKAFVEVDVPPLPFLTTEGMGDPGSSAAFASAIQALYGVSYTLKFLGKAELGRDYVVPPLEGLWWADDMAAFGEGDRAAWRWKLMIRLPDWAGDELLARARARAARKKPETPVDGLRAEVLDEGHCLQVLHVGSYAAEAEILRELHHRYMPEHGWAFNGPHHEVYLSNPGRTAQEKLRTILRQPVRPAELTAA